MSSGPLISVEELASRLYEPGLKILDESWFLPSENRSGREEFHRERKPGAAFVEICALQPLDSLEVKDGV